jgi:uncharacterized membrane protein
VSIPGAWHPILVHFAIALVVLGVALRWLSLVPRLAFAGKTALLVTVASAVAVVLAVESGESGHGPVESAPGLAALVEEHQDWGERTQVAILLVLGAELVALLLALWEPYRRHAKQALLFSGALGLGALFCVYEAGEHGGEIVYSHAGGVGLRTGDPADVGRLLLAGLYHQAQLDRKAGRFEDAARLVDEAVRRFPAELEIQLLAAESLLLDRHDPSGTLQRLGGLVIPKEERRLRLRHGLLLADALEAGGQPEGAWAALQSLWSEFPDSARLKKRLEGLSRKKPPEGGGAPR